MPSAPTHVESRPRSLPAGWTRDVEGEAEVFRLPFADARARGVAYLLAGSVTLLVLIAGLDLPRQLAAALRGSGGNGAVLSLVAMGAAVLAGTGVRSLIGREEWRVGDNYLEIRHLLLGFVRSRRYMGCRLELHGAVRNWSLLMERKGARYCLALGLDQIPALGLAGALVRSTGWPLTVRVEVAGTWLGFDLGRGVFWAWNGPNSSARDGPWPLNRLSYLRLERGREEIFGPELRDSVRVAAYSEWGHVPGCWLHHGPRGEGVEGWKDAYHVMTAWAALLHLPVRDDAGVDHWKAFGPDHVIPQEPPTSPAGARNTGEHPGRIKPARREERKQPRDP